MLAFPSRAAALVASFMALGCAASGALAQGAAGASQDSIQLQKLRNEMIRANKTKSYYSGKRFDVDKLPSYVPQEKVSGTLRIWGNNYMDDGMLKEYWDEGFRKYHPGVKIEWVLPTALVSTTCLVAKTCDIGANRRMQFTELLQYERMYGHAPLEIPMATGSLDVVGWTDAMIIYVNKDNPIKGLSLKQLDGIFGAERLGGSVGKQWEPNTTWHPEEARGADKNIRTWGQLGLTGDWANRPIQPVGAIVRYDTATKFSDAVLHGSDKWNEKTRMFSNYQGADGNMIGWQTAVADAVAGDLGGIGYTGMGRANANVRAVPIQAEDGGPYVMPTHESLQDRSYRLFQANYLYVTKEEGKPLDPKVREFLRYVLSKEGQEQVIREGRYLPLNAKLVENARALVN